MVMKLVCFVICTFVSFISTVMKYVWWISLAADLTLGCQWSMKHILHGSHNYVTSGEENRNQNQSPQNLIQEHTTGKLLFQSLKIAKTNIVVKGYSNLTIPLVQPTTQIKQLGLLVVAGEWQSLLGRTWLKVLCLDWKSDLESSALM